MSYAAISVMFARLARSFHPPRLARGFSAATPSFVEVNGQKFHVLSAGEATAPPLLCMPGAMGTAETDWAPQLEGLAAWQVLLEYVSQRDREPGHRIVHWEDDAQGGPPTAFRGH